MHALKPSLWAVCILIGLAFDGHTALSQATPFTPAPGTSGGGEVETGEVTISKRVDEVNLVFTVTDGKSHFVSNLEKSDFRLLDNHAPPEQIVYFQRQTELPLRVGLLIDISDSITSRFRFEQDAASTFLKKVLRPGVDQAFVVAFNQRVQLVQDMTSDTNALMRAVNSLKPGGDTALYDAITYACEKLNSGEPRVSRRALIVISDGVNTRSRAIMYDAKQAAARAEVVIFALSTNDIRHNGYNKGEAALDLLTHPTGGMILPAREKAELKSAFTHVETALRSQYALGYKPANLQADGSFRMIEILPQKPSLKAQCRRGYYAPKP